MIEPISIAINKINLYTKKLKIPNGTQIVKFDQEFDNETGIINLLSQEPFELEPNCVYCVLIGKTDGWSDKPDDSALMSKGIMYVPRKGTQFIVTTPNSKLIHPDRDNTVYQKKMDFIFVKQSTQSNKVGMMIRLHTRESAETK
jgi:hypothetical protein